MTKNSFNISIHKQEILLTLKFECFIKIRKDLEFLKFCTDFDRVGNIISSIERDIHSFLDFRIFFWIFSEIFQLLLDVSSN